MNYGSAPSDSGLASPATQLHTEKLSDMGCRIARVAHELNVPLSLITGSLDTLGQYTDALVQFVEATAHLLLHNQELARLHADLNLGYVAANTPTLLEICREGTHRLSHVVQQLRDYTRRTTEAGTHRRVDLKAVLAESVRLAGHDREPLPATRVQFEALPDLNGVADSLSQAFVNIIGNAFDAVASVPTPSVWVSAAVCLASPDWVEIRIRDNGSGIPQDLRARIFEPFFSTKTGRSGLGLGLVIAREIIESHGGTIELAQSEHGTAFVIRLPARDAAAAPHAGVPTRPGNC